MKPEPEIARHYWNFLQSGVQFFDELIEQLEQEYDFELKHFLKDFPALSRNVKRPVRLIYSIPNKC